MNMILQILLSVILVLGVLASLANSATRHRAALIGRAIVNSLHATARTFAFHSALLANDGGLTVGEHNGGRISGYCSSAPHTQRFLLMKQGSADNILTVVTSIADMPLAVCTDEPAATTDPVNFQYLNSAGKTQRMVASGAIAAGSIVVTNGDGKVKQMPAVAGVYWGCGVAVTTAADGDLVEVDPLRSQVGVSFVT